MKRFLGYCSILLGAIIGLALINDIVCVWLIRHSSSSSASKMERLWINPDPNEIPILGSSRALANYVPSIFSSECFNYGCNFMGKREVVFLMGIVAKRNSTKPVIINFDPWQSGDSFVGDYRLVPESKRLSKTASIPGLRFHGSLKGSIVEYLNSSRGMTKIIDHGAELLKNSRTADEWRIINSRLHVPGFHSDPTIDESFESAIREFGSRKVYVVVGPCSSSFTSRYSTHDQFAQYLEHLKEVCPNAVVINLFLDPSFSDDDFSDSTHLNIYGARKFSQKVAEILRLDRNHE